LVVCGLESQPCPLIDTLKKNAKVDRVLPLYACENIDTNTPSEDDLRSCEITIIDILKQYESFNEEPTYQELTDEDELSAGDSVMARVTSTTSYQKATIQKVHSDGAFYIVYDNGHMVQHTPRSNIYQFLPKSAMKHKLRSIVLDSSAPITIAQVLYKIMMKSHYRKALFAANMFIVSLHEPKDAWRVQLLDRFRHDIIKNDPVYRAEVLVQSDSKSIEMGLLSSGDLQFVELLKSTMALFGELHPQLQVDIKNIQGGQFTFQPNFTPSSFALPKHYDQMSPVEQWNAQMPLGRQTIFQLEKKSSNTITSILSLLEDPMILNEGDRVNVNYMKDGQFYPGIIFKVNEDGTYYIKYDDGDEEDNVGNDQIEYTFEVPISEKDLALSHSTFVNALSKLLSSHDLVCSSSEDGQCTNDIEDFSDLGEGSVIALKFSNLNVVVLWDGREHVDINVFTLDQDEEEHKKFLEQFLNEIPCLKLVLHDTQPRGIGSVVNFESDLGDQPRKKPHWV